MAARMCGRGRLVAFDQAGGQIAPKATISSTGCATARVNVFAAP
jgi:hypothetical protein